MPDRGKHENTQQLTGESLLRLLMESMGEFAVFVLDPAGHILTWNAGARLLTGYAPHEVIGQHVSFLYPPDAASAEGASRALDQATRSGRFEDEGGHAHKDGSLFRAAAVTTALRDDSGELIGFGKLLRDASGKRHARDELPEGEASFRLLVQSVKDYGIFMLDPDGTVASWNEGAEAIKGYAAKEIVGRSFSVFYPPDDLARNKPAMELEVAANDGRFEDEGWRLRKDGTRFWANVVITPLRSPEGELVGFAKVTRDLTERRALEEAALLDARRAAEAESANRAKGEFLAALSHELRTPLNAIGGYVDLMAMGLRGPVSEQQVGDLERVRRSQRHLLGIINDLLNFSRIEAGQVSYTIGTVSLARVVADVRALIEPLAVSKALAIEWKLSGDEPAARADASKMEQILVNLLTNAVKFTEEAGRVTVWGRVEDDRAVLSVEDDGIGIEPDRIEDIFEPFVQVGRSLASSHEGTGLGLAISRDLARAMDGDLLVDSRPGEGSTFTLVLPRAEPSGP